MEETPSYGLRMVLFSLAQRSLCPDGTCVQRSWSHILISPGVIVSSGHVPQEIMKLNFH